MKKGLLILFLGCVLLAGLFFSQGSYSIIQAANDSGLTTHQTDLFLQSASENSSSLPFPELKPIPAGEVAEISAAINYEADAGKIHEIHYPDADFIKVRFAEMNLLPGDYVTVSDPAGEEVYTYPGSGYTTDDDPGFWAMSITGDTAVVELHRFRRGKLSLPTGKSLADYGIQINKYTHGFPGILDTVGNLDNSAQSTCGTNQRTDVACYETSHPTEFAKSHAVARMLLNNGSSLCTGWRVGPNPDTLMTNEHCITSQSGATAAEAWFNYQRTSCGGSMASEVKVTGNSLLVDSYDYDFALITINNAASVASFGYLEIDPRTPVLGEEIYIAQHGSGNPKEFGIESDLNSGNVCRIDDAINNGRATNSDTGYYCDTIGGSSGSPVFARSSHKVIAIHHFGISGSTCTASDMNGGVRMDLIWPLIEPFLDTSPTTPTPTSSPTPVTPTATNTPLPGNQVFFDDFESNQGWTTNPNGSDTATTGQWERANPEETNSSGTTLQLGTTVSGSFDLVTEGTAGSSAGTNDIDNGVTTIRSPNINLPSSGNINLSFWHYLGLLSNANTDDYLRVSVVGNTTSVVYEEFGNSSARTAVWAESNVSLNSFAGQTIYILVEAADGGSGSLVEAGIDDVSITADVVPPTATSTSVPPTATNTPIPPTPTSTSIPPTATNTPTPSGDVFFDDFESDQGWTVNPNGSDNATTGLWERANPETTNYSGSDYQLGNTTSGSFDLVTGGAAGSGVGSYDIDGGTTSVRSPNISLPSSGNLTLSFDYYLSHYSNSGSDDFLRITVVGNTTSVVFEELGAGDIDAASWATATANLNSFAGQTVYILIEAADGGSGSLVEAAVDDVRITSN